MKSLSLSPQTRVPRRRRLGVEYCLILVIAGFAALSTVNAVSTQPGAASGDRVTVRPQ